ncbi:hypothetical protein ABN763_02705 [Spongiivirga sp. MCCC 1A20706]|uniref:hypothetical protein n=1 Tax=Spongiivirga sp. MCCC 1A20706 TaxID=3160963 RepID=UPI003977A27D
MKKIVLLLVSLYFMVGCTDAKLNHQDTITAYYNARNKLDFNELKTLVNDSITIISGDYVMPYNTKGFYEVFKWDSIFKPSYKLVELEEKSNQVIANVKINSVRNTFLKNSDMTCQYRISFSSGKISKIEELNCTNVDWNTWRQGVDSLTSWIKKHHPELDGFINDMTMNGAENYLKAIELYQANVD